MWESLTEAQAILLSGLLTIAAAVLGVLLGYKLFGDKVTDLRSAFTESGDVIERHRSKVESDLDSIRGLLADFNGQLIDVQGMVTRTSGVVADIEVRQEQAVSVSLGEDSVEAVDRQDIRENWFKLRDLMESIVARERDGRTRAKYNRIDRRSYDNLLWSLFDDGKLAGEYDDYDEVYRLWLRYRSGRNTPSLADAERMSELVERLHRINGGARVGDPAL